MTLRLLDARLAVCRLPADAPVPAWAELDGRPDALASVTRTADELSVVCRWDDLPAEQERGDGLRVEGPMRAFVVDGPLAFDVVGVAAALTAPLAEAGIPLLMLATFDTDIVLVAARHVRRAVRALAFAGHAVRPDAPALPYAFATTPFGRIVAAASPRGLAWAALGDTDEALLDGLQRAFPSRTLCADDSLLAPALAALARTLDGHAYDGPLDASGTAFQRRVWAAVRAVPFGQTTTYAHLADALGLPPAGARTVGQAVAANPVALAVPCHRVVRADGRPTAFRWGAPRKLALLAHERGGQLALFGDEPPAAV